MCVCVYNQIFNNPFFNYNGTPSDTYKVIFSISMKELGIFTLKKNGGLKDGKDGVEGTRWMCSRGKICPMAEGFDSPSRI